MFHKFSIFPFCSGKGIGTKSKISLCSLVNKIQTWIVPHQCFICPATYLWVQLSCSLGTWLFLGTGVKTFIPFIIDLHWPDESAVDSLIDQRKQQNGTRCTLYFPITSWRIYRIFFFLLCMNVSVHTGSINNSSCFSLIL